VDIAGFADIVIALARQARACAEIAGAHLNGATVRALTFVTIFLS
jgi:hypothetical protein